MTNKILGKIKGIKQLQKAFQNLKNSIINYYNVRKEVILSSNFMIRNTKNIIKCQIGHLTTYKTYKGCKGQRKNYEVLGGQYGFQEIVEAELGTGLGTELGAGLGIELGKNRLKWKILGTGRKLQYAYICGEN